jgi:hypothetical protein
MPNMQLQVQSQGIRQTQVFLRGQSQEEEEVMTRH